MNYLPNNPEPPDCGWDYEPEYDLVAAKAENDHAEQHDPAFKAMMDKLRARNAPPEWYSMRAENPYPKTEEEPGK